MKYRKKPIVIEAWHWHQHGPSYGHPAWLALALKIWPASGGVLFEPDYPGGARIAINTLEGVISAMPGDWIIRGIKGELYPCKPDIFEATYEPGGAHQ